MGLVWVEGSVEGVVCAVCSCALLGFVEEFLGVVVREGKGREGKEREGKRK